VRSLIIINNSVEFFIWNKLPAIHHSSIVEAEGDAAARIACDARGVRRCR